MHPVLTYVTWHDVVRPIGSYGALLSLALLVGGWLALRAGERAGLESGALISSLAVAVGCGFVGACGCSVLVRYAQLGSLRAALAAPGIVYYGALLAGGSGLGAAARAFGLPVLATVDALVPALPIAHALGRIGCFLGGCCFGAPSHMPWAVRYPGQTVARHPWPLYEAAVLCLLAGVFLRVRPGRPGARAGAYVLCYACARLALEPLRGDAIRGVFGAAALSTSELISLGLLATGAAASLLRRQRSVIEGQPLRRLVSSCGRTKTKRRVRVCSDCCSEPSSRTGQSRSTTASTRERTTES